jgi:hypothetical protein
MGDFVDKLQSKAAADEDIYFAKHDAELIEALHKKKLAKMAKCSEGDKKQAKKFEKRFEAITEKNKNKPRKLLRAYRILLKEIKVLCRRRR